MFEFYIILLVQYRKLVCCEDRGLPLYTEVGNHYFENSVAPAMTIF